MRPIHTGTRAPRDIPARAPERPPATSPSDPRFFDERDLEGELLRTFQICHECRMCVSYCGSFPTLFDAVDRDVDSGAAEGVEALTDADIHAVSEQCWQCKLCFIKCPYTKDEDASELLDFPRLMLREKATRARRNGVDFTDQLLGEPQLLGALGAGMLSPLSNFVHESRLLRKVAEKTTGISAEFPLPRFAKRPFKRWLGQHKAAERAGEAGSVVLFSTCYGNYNTPEVSQAAVVVLEHCGYSVITVEETCCGMPNLDGGDLDGASAKVRDNTALLIEHVRAGHHVVVPSPTCGMTIKKLWPDLVDQPEVHEVAGATLDLMEFLERRRKSGGLPDDFEQGLGQVTYHAACHLRAQKIGFPGMRVLSKSLPDTEVRLVQECSAVDGTWGMKAAHYETGRRYAQRLVKAVAEDEDSLVVTDCPLSALRIRHENNRDAIHPVEALARAYGLRYT